MLKTMFGANICCVLFCVLSSVSPQCQEEAVEGSMFAMHTVLHPATVLNNVQRDVQDFERFPDKSQGPQKGYSWSAVAGRDGVAGRPLFIVVDNKVYDVTDFADFHPAGPGPLKRFGGRDASLAMRASAMPQEVYDVFLNRFLVGWVIPMAEVQRYSLADVAVRTGRGGQPLWIVYKDKVYDLTKYAAEHPGGVDLIVTEAGTDATKAFDESGHTPDAFTIMAKYKIGELVEEEQRYDANGKKKKKKVVSAQPEGGSKSCMSVVTCGLLG